MTDPPFTVERQQLESGRFVQVVRHGREGSDSSLVIATSEIEQEAIAMSVALANAIQAIIECTPR